MRCWFRVIMYWTRWYRTTLMLGLILSIDFVSMMRRLFMVIIVGIVIVIRRWLSVVPSSLISGRWRRWSHGWILMT